MYDIPVSEISDDFAACWSAAGRHLQRMGGESIRWLKAKLEPPFLEHLSFMYGNQVFFVQLECPNYPLDTPGNRRGLMEIARGWNGLPCILSMLRKEDKWVPAEAGWGLLDARNRTRVDPPALTTGALIEITDWELHDFAVQLVRENLEGAGRQIMSSQGNPEVDPSLWFVGEQGPEWVVVRAVRYPELLALRPSNWGEITAGCAKLSSLGHFVSVSLASQEDAFAPDIIPPEPLYRGQGAVSKLTWDGMDPTATSAAGQEPYGRS